jgi:hypothetical protein
MLDLKVGETFVTKKSGVIGTIKEVVQNASGSLRVRLEVKGNDRWTTVMPYKEVWSEPIK